MPQLSSDFTARSDLNTFRRLATDVKHRVSREPVYEGFGARGCPQMGPEESELAGRTDASEIGSTQPPMQVLHGIRISVLVN